MFEKEFQEWFEINKKWLYSSNHLQTAYSAWCAGIKFAAQQSTQNQGEREEKIEEIGQDVCIDCGKPYWQHFEAGGKYFCKHN